MNSTILLKFLCIRMESVNQSQSSKEDAQYVFFLETSTHLLLCYVLRAPTVRWSLLSLVFLAAGVAG